MNTIVYLLYFSLFIVNLVLIILIYVKINSSLFEEYRQKTMKRLKATKLQSTTIDPCKNNPSMITNYQSSCDEGHVDGEFLRTKCHGIEKSLLLKECTNFKKKDWKNWTILNTNIGLCGETLRCETKSYP